ncbi:MAG: YkgJ family cysteine cluster protein [Deltaproteobacteria bacterium]|nr:YkgJ family cysteine cluster protein [Deltaproteobacteria bacterium]
MSAQQPWYGDGLPFSCTQCGACCTGDPGAVWVSPGEIAALARFLGLPTAELDRRYVRLRGVRQALHERFNGDCIFYDRESAGCRVYPVRPAQCRAWPFWEALVATAADWEATSEACPGCGRGQLVSHAEILHRQATLAAPRAVGTPAHRSDEAESF